MYEWADFRPCFLFFIPNVLISCEVTFSHLQLPSVLSAPSSSRWHVWQLFFRSLQLSWNSLGTDKPDHMWRYCCTFHLVLEPVTESCSSSIVQLQSPDRVEASDVTNPSRMFQAPTVTALGWAHQHPTDSQNATAGWQQKRRSNKKC